MSLRRCLYLVAGPPAEPAGKIDLAAAAAMRGMPE